MRKTKAGTANIFHCNVIAKIEQKHSFLLLLIYILNLGDKKGQYFI